MWSLRYYEFASNHPNFHRSGWTIDHQSIYDPYRKSGLLNRGILFFIYQGHPSSTPTSPEHSGSMFKSLLTSSGNIGAKYTWTSCSIDEYGRIDILISKSVTLWSQGTLWLIVTIGPWVLMKEHSKVMKSGSVNDSWQQTYSLHRPVAEFFCWAKQWCQSIYCVQYVLCVMLYNYYIWNSGCPNE